MTAVAVCIAAVFALTFISVLLCAVIVSRRLNRSVTATFAEWYMRFSRGANYYDRAVAELEGLKAEGDTPYKLPRGVKSKVIQYKTDGLQVYEFNPAGGGHTVLALYGGAYVHRPLKYHIKFYDKLACLSDCRIVMPVLPRSPFSTVIEGYRAAMSVYLAVVQRGDIVLLGDSSGGGLAVGLTLKLKEEGRPLPEKLILLAPWVDMTMTNEDIPDYEMSDPRNSRALAKLWGSAWAGGMPLNEAMLSPIYGDLSGLPPVVQYVGTRDLLYPDCKLFHQKLKSAGVKSAFVEGMGLNHVYPLYPIPEARTALSQISQEISNSAFDGEGRY